MYDHKDQTSCEAVTWIFSANSYCGKWGLRIESKLEQGTRQKPGHSDKTEDYEWRSPHLFISFTVKFLNVKKETNASQAWLKSLQQCGKLRSMPNDGHAYSFLDCIKATEYSIWVNSKSLTMHINKPESLKGQVLGPTRLHIFCETLIFEKWLQSTAPQNWFIRDEFPHLNKSIMLEHAQWVRILAVYWRKKRWPQKTWTEAHPQTTFVHRALFQCIT